MNQGSAKKWTDAEVATLMRAFRAGGRRSAIAAFPGRPVPAVTSAIRRFKMRGSMSGGPVSIDRDEVRERMRALPIGELFSRLGELLRVDERGGA